MKASRNKRSKKQGHDLVFKKFLFDPNTACDFLEAHLPPALRELCDLTTLRLEPGSFIEPELRAHYSDILYSVRMAEDRKAYIFCLIEHQSEPEKLMAFRLMRYCIGGMYNHTLEGHEKLPLVIPLLFYHGKISPYPSRTCWLDLFDQPEIAAKLYTSPFPLVDVTVLPDDEILKHKRIALLELVQKHIRQRDMMELAQEITFLLRLGLCTNEQLETLVNYILQMGETEDPQALLQTLATASPQYEDVVMTIAQKLEQRARQKGWQEGLQEGWQEGLQEGEQKGEQKAIHKMARQLLDNAVDRNTIIRVTGLSESELNQLSL